jgi:RNA polymerase sigma-70 factor (ECF subfamily)
MLSTNAKPVEDIQEPLDFEGFFHTEYPRLVKSLYLTTLDLLEAEELAQEAMARAFERWDRVKAMDAPGGYLYRMALNLNRKRIRRLAVRARRILWPVEPVDAIAASDAKSDLLHALAGLPEGQKEALVLLDWMELTSEEAGRILGIRAASVRSRAHRAREKLQGQLGVRDE